MLYRNSNDRVSFKDAHNRFWSSNWFLYRAVFLLLNFYLFLKGIEYFFKGVCWMYSDDLRPSPKSTRAAQLEKLLEDDEIWLQQVYFPLAAGRIVRALLGFYAHFNMNVCSYKIWRLMVSVELILLAILARSMYLDGVPVFLALSSLSFDIFSLVVLYFIIGKIIAHIVQLDLSVKNVLENV